MYQEKDVGEEARKSFRGSENGSNAPTSDCLNVASADLETDWQGEPGMDTNYALGDLSQKHFTVISRMMYELCGLSLPENKMGMVKARLLKRLRALRFNSFEQYLRFVRSDESGRELTSMIDALTTNKTSFFREQAHFDFLRATILTPLIAKNRRIRIWSAGCSSGEEPFSLAILLKEEVPDVNLRDVRMLATDISHRMLEIAREAVYEKDILGDISPQFLNKYFTCVRTKPSRAYKVNHDVRSIVKLAWLNLIEDWPMAGPFNMIFCRNVMIYFDKPTRQRLIQRFWDILEPGGYLLVGHSESLTGSSHKFSYVQPAVYLK